jgi:hypothetical protein
MNLCKTLVILNGFAHDFAAAGFCSCIVPNSGIRRSTLLLLKHAVLLAVLGRGILRPRLAAERIFSLTRLHA